MGITLPPLSVLLRDALRDYRAAALTVSSEQTFSSIEPPASQQPTGESYPETVKKCNEDVTLFPRRKAGQAPKEGGRGPVVLSVELLEKFYGMPLHTAAKKLVRACPNSYKACDFRNSRFAIAYRFRTIAVFNCSDHMILFGTTQGICQTAIKKVCR
jgi:hypothetical protein